jgi:hypothetical protein
MNIVVSTVNFIRSRSLNHRQFRELLIDTEAVYGDVIYHSQANGPVGQVETSPEILLVYRAHLVMIADNILAASTRRKGVKKLPKLGTHSSEVR